MTEGEMIGWHHLLNGPEFEQAPEDGERQGSLACCSPWGHKESDMTECWDNNKTVNSHTKCSSEEKGCMMTGSCIQYFFMENLRRCKPIGVTGNPGKHVSISFNGIGAME